MSSGASVTSVGISPVVPNGRKASAIFSTPSGDGSSLNSAPPPPLTCTSMKPGASRPPPRSRVSAATRALGVRNDRRDARAVDDERVVVEKALAIEQPRAGQHEHQTVSVTLRKLRGLSGLRPSRRATASASR